MRKFLIHLLGGHTHKEMCDELVRSSTLVRLDALYTIQKFADQMNGMPADDWCKLMYSHICGTIARIESPTTVPDGSPSGNTNESYD